MEVGAKVGDSRSEVLPLIVEVTWRDAFHEFEQKDADDARGDYIVHTVGYLVRETEAWVSVAQEILPDGDGLRGVTHIPTSLVVNRDVIKPRPTASLMTSVQGGHG